MTNTLAQFIEEVLDELDERYLTNPNSGKIVFLSGDEKRALSDFLRAKLLDCAERTAAEIEVNGIEYESNVAKWLGAE